MRQGGGGPGSPGRSPLDVVLFGLRCSGRIRPLSSSLRAPLGYRGRFLVLSVRETIQPVCCWPCGPVHPAFFGSTVRSTASRELSGKWRWVRLGWIRKSCNAGCPLRSATDGALHGLLNKREQEVARRSAGWLDQQGDRRPPRISEGATKSSLREIFRKAGVRRRSQLVSVALSAADTSKACAAASKPRQIQRVEEISQLYRRGIRAVRSMDGIGSIDSA